MFEYIYPQSYQSYNKIHTDTHTHTHTPYLSPHMNFHIHLNVCVCVCDFCIYVCAGGCGCGCGCKRVCVKSNFTLFIISWTTTLNLTMMSRMFCHWATGAQPYTKQFLFVESLFFIIIFFLSAKIGFSFDFAVQGRNNIRFFFHWTFRSGWKKIR